MVLDHFKTNCTDGTAPDLLDLVKFDLKNDNVHTVDTYETISALRKQPDDEVSENLYFWQLNNAGQLLLPLYIQEEMR